MANSNFIMCPSISKIKNTRTGSYALILKNQQPFHTVVGKLGSFMFPVGYYAYTGSALGPGGLNARLNRHLKVHKKYHWHIDYIIERMKIEEIWCQFSNQNFECKWRKLLKINFQGSHPFKKFGSSDCMCNSHLILFKQKPNFHLFSLIEVDAVKVY